MCVVCMHTQVCMCVGSHIGKPSYLQVLFMQYIKYK